MLAVWSWLMELVELDRDVDPEQGALALTGAGLEVESVERLGDAVAGVVVAEVTGTRKHPDADKLILVDLITVAGGVSTEVVCGAPNVPEPGGRVLWAAPGAVLPGGMKIGARTIKGVTSAGMICAEDELGIGDDHDGIIVLRPGEGELGQEAQDVLGLRDVVFEIGVPANRPDALGLAGIARELAALLGGRFKGLDIDLAPLTDEALDASELVTVDIADPDGCPRYIARVIDGLTVGPSPRWMQQRLRAVGVRPLSNLIDVTNYVMFETGQPLHAFDYAEVRGARIDVRRATAGETMKTLDDVERTLVPDDLLICDGERPVALAGVMGGADSEVGDATTRVLLETASFDPRSIRRTAKRLGLHSESSHRFERHVDAEGAELASRRAAQLLAQLGGGRVARGSVDNYPKPPSAGSVTIRASRASALIGVDFSRERVAELLGGLGIPSEPVDDDTLRVTCPTYRPDLVREVDLIEETIRVHGFDKVPATLPRTDVPPSRVTDRRPYLARRALVGIGMSEAITFGFTSPARIAALRLPDGDPRSRPLAIRNPMSVDQSVMRTALLPNLLGALARNISYGVPDVRLFEVGSVFLPSGDTLPHEPTHVAGVISGRRSGWLKADDAVDFFDAKGIVERLLSELLGSRAGVSFTADAGIGHLHPGLCASIALPDGTVVGHVGEIHPDTREAFEVEAACFGFEMSLEAFPAPAHAQMTRIPRYPAVTRDLSFFVSASVPASRVASLIDGASEALVERVTVLEDYRDVEKVPEGQKGMLWSITYRSGDRTLTDAEVDTAHEAIVDSLLRTLPAERR